MFLRKFAHLTRLQRPADDDLSTGGGAVDRGDSFTPTVDDDEPKKPAGKAPAAAQNDDTGSDQGDAADPDAADPDAADPDAADDGEGKPKRKSDARIPLSRHEKILQKERERREAAEAQLAQFQKGKEVVKANEQLTEAENKLLELEDKHTEALADGDVDKAKALMRQIRTMDRQLAEARADARAAEAEARAVERARYDIVLERIESTYPQLNEDHDDYDKDLAQDVIDLSATYQRRGLTPAQALQKAVKKLVGAENSKQEQATEVTPRVDAAAVAAQRKKDAVAKTVDAAKRTPPNTSRVGKDSDSAGGSLRAEDVLKMSQDDFMKLDDAELKRLRGDEI